MLNKRKKPKDGWFFNRNLLSELNQLTEEETVEKTIEEPEAKETERQEAAKEPELVEKKVVTLDQQPKGLTLQELREENLVLKEQQKEWEKEKQELLEKQTNFTTVTKRLMDQKERYRRECEQVRIENKKIVGRIGEQVKEDTPLSTFRTEEVGQLKAELQENKRQLAEKMTTSNQELERLAQQVTDLRNQVTGLAREKEVLTNQNERLQRQVSLAPEKTTIGEPLSFEEKDALNQALYQAHSEIIQLQETLEKEKQQTRNFAQIEQELANKNEMYVRLKEQFMVLSQETPKVQELRREKEQLKSEMSQLETQSNRILEQASEKDQSIQLQRQKLKDYEEQIRSLNQRTEELDQELRKIQTAYESEKVTASELERKYLDLQAEAVAKQDEVSKILWSAKKQENDILQEARKEAQQLVSSAEKKARTIEGETYKLAQKLEHSQNEIRALCQDIHEKIEETNPENPGNEESRTF